MITKGSAEYKKAQNMASLIEQSATESQIGQSEGMYASWAVADVLKMTGIFAVEIAKTISQKFEKYNRYYISSKQAWILACALIEAGIEY